MKTIYLVRHGESAANAGLPTSDPALIPLAGRGRAQASPLATILGVRPSIVMTSAYSRAIDTTRPFAQRHGLDSSENALLHEFVTLDPASVAGTTMLERRPLLDSYWTLCRRAWIKMHQRRAAGDAEEYRFHRGRTAT